MKEFIASLVFILVVGGYVWLRTDFTRIPEAEKVQGLPDVLQKEHGGDQELQNLLAAAQTGGQSEGAEVVIPDATPTIAMGEEIYNLGGANSCLYCHGIKGTGGNVASAAKLNNPSAWKIAKILGGQTSGDEFRSATINLIAKGALVHNSTYANEAPWFDVNKGGGPYDAQMVGMTGAPSAKYVRENKDQGVTPQVAAEALYMYIETF